eukprot:scaffold3674_cov371-Prasinococcus_capsulatus_cf.AAC.5
MFRGYGSLGKPVRIPCTPGDAPGLAGSGPLAAAVAYAAGLARAAVTRARCARLAAAVILLQERLQTAAATKAPSHT